jgi:hypothetical protein
MTLDEILDGQSIVQILLDFGVSQEIKEDTEFSVSGTDLVLTHASKGRTIIAINKILLINTVPKGHEPPSWKRER